MALEPTHTVNFLSKLLSYLKDIWGVLLVVLAVGVLGWIMSVPIRSVMGRNGISVGKGQESCRRWLWLLCCAVIMLAAFLFNILSVGDRDAYGVIFLFLVGVRLWESSILQGEKRRIYVCGSVIGGLEFLATLILTDLRLTVSVVYGLLAIIFALVPIKEQMKGIKYVPIKKWLYRCAMCFIALLALRCAYIRTPLTG